jgi:hypothetical protein
MDPAEPQFNDTAIAAEAQAPLGPELTPSGKPKKRFIGKARKQQQHADVSSDPTIEDSAVAIRDGNHIRLSYEYLGTLKKMGQDEI